MANERLPTLFTLPMEEQRRLFGDMKTLYPTRLVACGGAVSEFVTGEPLKLIYRSDGENRDIEDFMQRYRAAGLLIIKRGAVVCERYALGQTRDTPWISFSMAKSISSTLVGAAIHDGLIASIDEPVVRTVPGLRGSAYEGVSIRHVLQMSSGVRWSEAYLDPRSDRRQLLTLQASEEPGAVLRYLGSLGRAAAPGTTFNYNTAETFLLGLILAGAVKRPLCDYLSEKIWKPCGMEADAYWQLESPDGQEFAGSGWPLVAGTVSSQARQQAVLHDQSLLFQRLLSAEMGKWRCRPVADVGGRRLSVFRGQRKSSRQRQVLGRHSRATLRHRVIQSPRRLARPANVKARGRSPGPS